MHRTVFLIKTLVVIVLLVIIAWISISSWPRTNNDAAYVWVVDPSQTKSDLQQVKNILHGYLQAPSSHPIGLILWTQKPIFLLPPTYDTWTLRTYIESIQSQPSEVKGNLAPLLQSYSSSHIFVSSDKSHAYRDIQDFASIDTLVQANKASTIDTWKLGLCSVLLIVVLLI